MSFIPQNGDNEWDILEGRTRKGRIMCILAGYGVRIEPSLLYFGPVQSTVDYILQFD